MHRLLIATALCLSFAAIATAQPNINPPVPLTGAKVEKPVVARSEEGLSVRVVPVAVGLSHPTGLVFLPDGHTMLVTERPGHLLDPRYPRKNPTLEWSRLGRAVADAAISKILPEHEVPGGSTLATQIEKYRHSPEGRTVPFALKTREMSERAYSRASGALDVSASRCPPRLRCSAVSSIFWKVWFCESLSHPASSAPPMPRTPVSAVRRVIVSRVMANRIYLRNGFGRASY